MEKIDDRDSSVVYSQPLLGSDWTDLGDPNEYQGTTSLTWTKGANAKITFNGTSIAIYGTVSSRSLDSGTTSLYSVDGNTGTEYTTSPTTDTRYQVKFFQSLPLDPGQHTLEIVNESQGGWLWLDYFLVGTNSTSSPNATSSSSPPTSTVASATTPLTPTIIVTSMPNSLDSSSAGSHSHQGKGSNAGIIVGSILGGIFGLLFLFGLFWFVRRKLADRYAEEAAAIPADASIPSPISKAAQSLVSTHKVHDSEGGAGYNISSTPAMAQMHQHRHQQYSPQALQLHQQHTRYGSRTSVSNVYPFSPSAQQAYHSNVGPNGCAPPLHTGMPQHEHTPSSSDSYPTASGDGVNLGYNPYLHGQANSSGTYGSGDGPLNTIKETGYEHNNGQSENVPARPPSSDASPPAYPGVPPGLSDPRAP